MTYEEQTWDTNSYINPTRMNHIEAGIGAAADAIGDNDISAIGDGTLTGGVSSLNSSLTNLTPVTEITGSTYLEAIQNIHNTYDCKKPRLFTISSRGVHTVIAHNYGKSSLYGSYLFFDCWGKLTLYCNNEGTWTTKDVFS